MINTCLFMDLHQNIYFYPSVTVLQTWVKGGSMLYSTWNLEHSTLKPRYLSWFMRYIDGSSRNPLRQVQERWRLCSTSCTVILKQHREKVGRLQPLPPRRGRMDTRPTAPLSPHWKATKAGEKWEEKIDWSHTWLVANSARSETAG